MLGTGSKWYFYQYQRYGCAKVRQYRNWVV